jgi:hypothetical protein
MRPSPFSFCVRVTLMTAVSLAAVNLLVLVIRFPAYAALPACVIAWRNRGNWRLSTAHGSARASSIMELISLGMIGRGRGGMILGTTGYLDPPGKGEALAALFSPGLPSTLAVRLFLAGFFGKQWMED